MLKRKRNAKGGKAHKMNEERAQIPASKSTAVRLQKIVRPFSRRKVVDRAVNNELDKIEDGE